MGSLPRRHWHEMTTEDFGGGNTGDWIAVLPIAAIEQHGPHLPVFTDTCIAEGQLAETIKHMPEDLPVTFLPVQAIGASDEHISYAGTLTYSCETAMDTWRQIGDAVHRAGIRKFVLVSSHGGNNPLMEVVTRDLRVRHNMLAVGSSWLRYGQPEGVYPKEESLYGIHGGDVETSIMQALRPDLVRMDLAEDFKSTQLQAIEQYSYLRAHGRHQYGWMSEDLNPKGAMGNAKAATPEKGRASLEFAAKEFIKLLTDVHAFDVNRLGKL
ncbi:creatininase family protein [Flexibacterium corallicola]|uniref:creatininase family protein n=1 Tax=Flexibacterium corallicola TaxID=3037259 RepID=UPI00286EE520|nr:creatininase family protein [Pseudovibrio sp. M1P-2-3]